LSVSINIQADSAAEARSIMAELLGSVDTEALVTGLKQSILVGERLAETEGSGAKIIKGLEEAAAGEIARETVVEVQTEPKKRGRPAKAKAEPKAEAEPQIRTQPENRVEEPEEDAIQDIQDEIAEVEAARNPVASLTVDDVRQALGGYVKKYGTPAALEDGAKLLAQALGTPPEGEPIWKMSILPDDQDALRKAAETVNAAIEGNPFSREAV
jgi:hypothetical protein